VNTKKLRKRCHEEVFTLNYYQCRENAEKKMMVEKAGDGHDDLS
jgi:hypothetical protein